ncbi:MAG: leucine-rich repeat protein [Candidatus Nomurabacteria bacterium]|nr:MAG: leucine-rich repeat protein [Candidatus Nomurabacteria bacterium]
MQKFSVSMFGCYKDNKTIEGTNKFMAYLKPASVSASLIAISLVLALSTTLALIPTNKAYAITPPDSCFNFNAGTNTITGYYEHENNNPSDPACPKAVDIPSTIGGVAVNVIGDYAMDNEQLTSVTIPGSVTTIGNSAFYANQLTNVTIPNSVIYMGESSFENNLLTNVTIPNSVTSMNTGLFAYNQLTSVTIPNSVTSIGNAAFQDNQLTSVTIPNSVTSIGNAAFQDNQLTSVTIPNSVTSIGDHAFMFNQLTSINIPNSVTSLGSFVFNADQLSEVFIPSSVTTMSSTSIGGQTVPDTPTYIDYANSGYSPSVFQALIDGTKTCNVYIDPSQATILGLADLAMTEADFGMPDSNGNGDTSDILLMTLINPSRAVVKYQDGSGNDLLPSSTITGYDTGSSTTLTNYLLKDNPSKDINAYYKVGDTVDLPSAPNISGYSLVSTPPTTLALSTTGANEIIYTYKTGGSNSIPNAEDSKTVVLDLPTSTTLSNFVAVKESSLAVQDSGYNYPLGLIDFSFSTSTTDNTVSLLFVTDLKPNQVIAKKYDPSTKGYTTLDNATITETTHNNQHALLLTYTITDNGDLDLDKTTGIIKDPVGLATLAVGSPNTGVR